MNSEAYVQMIQKNILHIFTYVYIETEVVESGEGEEPMWQNVNH